jgi:photosystem II stability/assembly factor-like uncharacterized protein
MQMRKFNILLLILFSTQLYAQNNTAELMPKFTESLFLSVESNGTNIFAVGARGHVAISNDYGVTWEQAKNVPTRTTLTALSVVNKNVWVVGHDTTILHSPDAGRTWEVQFQDAEREMPLLDVLFINESEGFAIGAYGTYLTTFDGGKNWEDSLISEDDDYHLNQIIKIDQFKFFVVAESGYAYRSFDAGKTWESLTLPYNGSMFGAVAVSDQIVTYGLRGHVLVSDDFGMSFDQIESPSQNSLFGSTLKDDNSVLIAGANGTVLHYKNRNIVKVEVPDSEGDYTDLISIKNNKIVFVGEAGISTKKIR